MKNISHISSIVPFLTFLIFTIYTSFAGSMDINLLIAIGVGAAVLGGIIASDKKWYWETIVEYMGNRTAMTAALLWLLVGVYGTVLKEGHLVEGLVWVTNHFEIGQASFTLIVFLFSGLFAISTGSGFGTISAMSITLFPAGIALGTHPAILGGAILSGAALGDSISPVSDTAVIAATTQEYNDAKKGCADIGGTIKNRMPFVFLAVILACLAFFISATYCSSNAYTASIRSEEDSRGLLMLIPTVLVIVMSLFRQNIFVSLCLGILLAITIGLSFDLYGIEKIIKIDDSHVSGAIVDGIGGMTSICILLMVVVSLSGLIIRSGYMEVIINYLNSKVAHTRRKDELCIFSLVAVVSILIAAVNTIANICVAPFVNAIGRQRGIHPYRRSTILATTICTLPFFLPYSGCVLLLTQGIETSACGVTLQAIDVFFNTFYCWILLLIMSIVCLTGYKSQIE